MFGSLRIGSVLGIKVRVHFLLLLLIAYILFAHGSAPLITVVITVLMLFGAVTLHELGHCIVARSFGVRVLDITLWPLGGMARMSDVPESGRIEGLVAVAGPIVNFILAALVAPVWWWASPAGSDQPQLFGIADTFLQINLLMAVLNLIPAFPTDGGRILRAILGRKGDWLRATETAVRVGRVFAVAIAITGLVLTNMGLVIIAIWLWWMGSQELMAVRLRHAPTRFDALRDIARRAAGWSWSSAGNPVAGASTGEAETARARGFTAEEIERLERFRGNLRNFRPR